jgi:hypothetical protein
MAGRRRYGAEVPANGNSSGSSSHHGSSSAKLVIENTAAVIAAASKQLSKVDLPRLFSLLNDEAAFIARRMMQEVESTTSYRDAVIGRRSSSSDGNEREQKMGESKRGRDGDSQQSSGSSHGSGRDGWSAPVPTARERYQQRIEKQKQRFPERPIHSRFDYNPSACQPGCYYHEEDQNKHDHRELHGWDGRSYKRGILRYPAAAKPAPSSSPQRSNSSSNSSSSSSSSSDSDSSNSNSSTAPDAPTLHPDWHQGSVSTVVGIAIAKHNSMHDASGTAPEGKEETKESPQQQPVPQQRQLPAQNGRQPSTTRPSRILPRRPLPPTPPPPLAGKRQPTTPDSPQDAPKRHQLGHTDDQNQLPLPPLAAVAEAATGTIRLPLPDLLATNTAVASSSSHSAQSSPRHV